MISNSLPAIPLAARIDRYLSKKLLDLIEIKMIKPSYDPELEPLPGNSNGSPKGDFYFISSEMDLKGGRLASGDYFRVTVPTFLLSDFSLKYKNAKILPENSLLIYPDGGVNFAKESKPLQAPFPVYSVTLCKPQEYPLELLLGLCTYLKSSFVLWYLCTMYQTDDLFSVMLSGRLLPLPSDIDLLKRLAIITNNVILSELSILKNIEKFRDYEEKKDIYRREIVKHNSECASNMKLIDNEVLRYFCVNKSEIE